jgi:hypothetical protein
LYKVGESYFVRDGNHRVSVARRHGRTRLPAYVWEYETPLPLPISASIDDLMSNAAHDAFVERTAIDRLCPGVEIRLSQADGYEVLLGEIDEFQQIIARIDERPIGWDEAVTVVRCTTPVVQIMRREHPGRPRRMRPTCTCGCPQSGELDALRARRLAGGRGRWRAGRCDRSPPSAPDPGARLAPS